MVLATKCLCYKILVFSSGFNLSKVTYLNVGFRTVFSWSAIPKLLYTLFFKQIFLQSKIWFIFSYDFCFWLYFHISFFRCNHWAFRQHVFRHVIIWWSPVLRNLNFQDDRITHRLVQLVEGQKNLDKRFYKILDVYKSKELQITRQRFAIMTLLDWKGKISCSGFVPFFNLGTHFKIARGYVLEYIQPDSIFCIACNVVVYILYVTFRLSSIILIFFVSQIGETLSCVLFFEYFCERTCYLPYSHLGAAANAW